MSKKKLLLLILIPVAVTAVTLSIVIPIAVSNYQKKHPRYDEPTPVQEVLDNNQTDFDENESIEEITEKVSIHTDLQHSFLNDTLDSINNYAVGEAELSRPQKAEFTWSGGTAPYQVYLSETRDYSHAYYYNVDEAKISFGNLKIDTKYYFKVISGEEKIKEASFIINDEIIRNMYVSGVTNVRDLGGYHVDGGVIKQGLIYRTGRINENSTETLTPKINEKGIFTMLNEMKVKSEIDLRYVENNEVGGLTEGVGTLGESVRYYQCPMDYNQPFDGELNDVALRKVFSILGDKANYPTFFHCSIGTDRTGYIAWLINACLGVNEENLYRDYLFSNFGYIGSKRTVSTIKEKYVELIKSSGGSSMKEQATNFLLNHGVKQSEIDTLREMMIG